MRAFGTPRPQECAVDATPEPSICVLGRSAQPKRQGRKKDRSVGRWLPPGNSFAVQCARALPARAVVATSAPSLGFLAGGLNGTLAAVTAADLRRSRRGLGLRNGLWDYSLVDERPDDGDRVRLGANLGGHEVRMVEPVEVCVVGVAVLHWRPDSGGSEVVDDDQAAQLQPLAGSIGCTSPLPCPPPSRTSISNGPNSLSSRQSPCTTVTCGAPANTALAASARSPSASTLTRRTPGRAPLAIQAVPTPHPIPVSPITPSPIPPARTCSSRPCDSRHEFVNPWRRAASRALRTSGGRSSTWS